MTPKEKSEELYVGYWYLTNDSRIAKQCALIAVDEIMNICPFIKIEYAISEGGKESDAKEYWIEVKNEINKQDSEHATF